MTAGSGSAGRSTAIPLWPLGAAALPFILLATLNAGGYRYGAADLAFYIPAALLRLDPAMFPRDAPLIASQAGLTTIDEVMAGLIRLTGVPLPPLLAALYAATLLLLAAGIWLTASRLYRTVPAAVALTAAMTLRHAISRTGTNTLEAYFHPRQLAFALGVLGLASYLHACGRARGGLRWMLPGGLVLAAGVLHPTTALWFALWLGAALAIEQRRLRAAILAAAAAGGAAAAWMLTAGPLAGRLRVMDPEWLATLASKDYLFPGDWPLDVWLVNLAYAPLIAWLYRRRRDAGALVPGERGLARGCLALLLVFAAALPLNASRVALVMQLQVPRLFWMLDLLASIYAVWAIAEGRTTSNRRAWIAAGVVAAASLARGSYVMFVKFPERQVARIALGDTDWARAMAWARGTPAGSGWLADPLHAVKYGTSLRVAGERDVFVEAVKDTAIGMYDRAVAIRTRDRLAELAAFDRLTPDAARALAAREGLDYLVTEQALDLPLAFRSGPLRIYRLR